MPSAKTVAQKPAGSFNPLSSLEHTADSDRAAVVVPCAHAKVALAHQPPKSAIASHSCLYRRERTMIQPPKCQTRGYRASAVKCHFASVCHRCSFKVAILHQRSTCDLTFKIAAMSC